MDELRVEVHQTPGEIACNFDEIEAALRNQMTAYAELEITEENIPERKADVATLRKIKGAVDDERKKVKKSFNEPLDAFEKRVKKITGIIDEQIVRINAGLDEFEQKRITEKKKHIQELYDENIGEYAEFLPLSVIESAKWTNKTCSDNEIISAIQTMRLSVQNDLQAIKALNSEFEEKLIAAYKASGNTLAVAIQKNTDYQEAARATEKALKEAAERKAREEAERAAREEAEKNVNVAAPTACQPAEPVNVWNDDTMNPPTLTIKVTGAEDVEALRNFLEMSGIRFEEV